MFIVEGLATIVIGMAIFFLLPDCKSTAFIFNLLKLTFLQSHLRQSGSPMTRKLSSKLDFLATLLKPKKQTSTFGKSLKS
jgi:hypothetical protein